LPKLLLPGGNLTPKLTRNSGSVAGPWNEKLKTYRMANSH
jgi:hypothetical protein